jgi:uncharacterized protein
MRYNLLFYRGIASRYLLMPAARQLGPFAMLALWAALCLVGTLYATWYGYGGRAFAATLTAFAFYSFVMLMFAARGVADGIAGKLGVGSGILLGSASFFFYLIYLLGTNTFAITRTGAVALFVFLPLALAASAERAAAGAWQDFLLLAAVWVTVKFGPSHWVWLYPENKLAYAFTVLLALNVALAAFVLMRRVNGIGYTIGWGPQWTFYVLASFGIFACVAIPLGHFLHFIAFDPQWHAWKSVPFTGVAILFLTAWPEEFLFRGLLQNMLARASKSDLAAWWTASVLFGFSHITNLGFPNWRYVILASIAGLFYGWTWRKTGSIFASAIVHGAVDTTWHLLFRTLPH